MIDKAIQEITIRRYERPHGDERELIKKFCLSVGLLQPGDSRDVIVDILYVLLNENEPISSLEVQRQVASIRKENHMSNVGIANSNIRRQLRRLRELMLIEKIGNAYQVTENESLTNIIESKIKPFIINNIMTRISEYAEAIDRKISEKHSK